MKYILNTDKGRAFIRDLRVAVKGVGLGGIKLRGRHRSRIGVCPNYRRAFSRDLPLKYASHFYFEMSTLANSLFDGLRAIYEKTGEKVVIEGIKGKKIKA